MEVKVYGTESCPWCKKVNAFLKDHDIAFSEVDVGSDEAGAEEMKKISGQMSVPVVDVGGEVVVGFDETKLKDILEIGG